ncbi:S41 family peptidase [Massilia sp. 9I]|uniref:S41 family peptidase n=1 Tax=Massilia sp. 9I TaxID=2653152 RepID=UPI0012F14A3F|nr:S41 family peptidase [Massilia sp. 9I]VXB40728.1 Carboxyl-terminal protease [Massilia sp. 9I]
MNRFPLAALFFCLAGAAHAGEQTVTVPAKALDQLLSTYALIKAQYVQQPDDAKLLGAALKGMLASLDPHSQYLDPDAYAEMAQERDGDYVGIGIAVEPAADALAVLSVSEGSPAALGGIKGGDSIVAIDGKRLAGMREQELAKRMRGLPGSTVKIGFRRGGAGPVRTVALERTALKADTVRTSMLAPGVAWIRISEFEENTAADLAAALAALDTAGKPGGPQGIVLDLRNDPGGAVQAAVGVAGAFLPQGAVVFSARGRAAGADSSVTVDQRFYRTPGEPDVLASLPSWTRTVPLVVLVNGSSASSAELLAGALQDHRRATVVGTRSFGKGSIQTVFPLADGGAVKLTVARYFTPNGRDIQASGIEPDIVAAPRKDRSGAPRLLLRESDLEHHLETTLPATAQSDRGTVENSRTFGTRDDAALAAAIEQLAPKPGLMGRASALLHKLGARAKL